jgi:hypothetical protein
MDVIAAQPSSPLRANSGRGLLSAPASLHVANSVLVASEGLHPYRPAITEGPDVGEAVVHLGAARLPAASLAHRCHDVSVELLDLEQLNRELVEGIVPLGHPLEQRLGASIASTVVATMMSGALSALITPRSRALIAAYMRAANSFPSGTRQTYRRRRLTHLPSLASRPPTRTHPDTWNGRPPAAPREHAQAPPSPWQCRSRRRRNPRARRSSGARLLGRAEEAVAPSNAEATAPSRAR